MKRFPTLRLLSAFAVALSISAICASSTYAAPAYSSRPGAAYTLYLDFDGFAFNGQWGNTGDTPGTTAAYTNSNQIAEIWARTAEKYATFNVNVTTVDPAVAAGQASSDAQRQLYYDNTARVMHTVVGGNGSWIGSPGGISYVGVTQSSIASGGYKTNFAFTDNLGNTGKYIADAISHEDGHGLGLSHQGDSNSEYSTNNNATGNNSYAPNMGVAYYSQKGTWSVGTVSTTTTVQNDVGVILANSGMTMLDSGIGHSFAGATSLPLTGTAVNSVLAQGMISPLASAGYNPTGVDNYTKDYFKFTVGPSGNVTLTVNNAGDWITPGVLSPGGTLRSKLNLFSSTNLTTPFAFGTENADATATTFTGSLAAGTYYAQITSFGGFTSSYDTQRQYFDMGSYTLSGSGFVSVVVPEGGTLGLLSLGLVGVVITLRRKK